MAFDEKAPASPRSLVSSNSAARAGPTWSSCSEAGTEPVSGCSTLEKLATADTARVIASA